MKAREEDEARRESLWNGENSKGYKEAAKLEDEAWASKERNTREQGTSSSDVLRGSRRPHS